MVNVKKNYCNAIFSYWRQKFFFEVLSTLTRYSASAFHLYIKTWIYFISKQTFFSFRRFYRFQIFGLCDDVTTYLL